MERRTPDDFRGSSRQGIPAYSTGYHRPRASSYGAATESPHRFAPHSSLRFTVKSFVYSHISTVVNAPMAKRTIHSVVGECVSTAYVR
jgi:hypothetical protein